MVVSLNARVPRKVSALGSTKLPSILTFLNASLPIEMTEFGSCNSPVRPLPLNALSPIDVTESGKCSSVRPAHLLNALLPMAVMCDQSTPVIPVFKNAPSGISVMRSGRTTVPVIPVVFANARIPRDSSESKVCSPSSSEKEPILLKASCLMLVSAEKFRPSSAVSEEQFINA